MKLAKMPQIWWNGLFLSFLLSIMAKLETGIFQGVFYILAIFNGVFIVAAFFILWWADASD